MNTRRLLLATILLIIAAFFLFDLQRFLDFHYLKSQQTALQVQVEDNPWLSIGLYAGAYLVIAAFSLPGAAVMTLLAGALFDVINGSLIVSFASTLGASLNFLFARYLLRDSLERRFGNVLSAVNRGIARDGALYLLTIRLVPLFPFFVVNPVMGLTGMRLWTFFWVSQLGMLPATILFVNAGTRLAALETPAGLLSPTVIASLSLLGLFPWLARLLIKLIRHRQLYRHYPRPRRFDRNLIVIGAGAAGLVTAYIAAAVKAKVTLIEKHRMGGDCLNTGCVPSKALIRTSRFLADLRNAEALGVRRASADFEFSDIMARVRRKIKQIEPHDSVERYQALGVECLSGAARITSPWSVEINGQALTAPNIVLATGGRPRIPDIEGIAQVNPLTSENLWQLDQLPGRLLVIGGGAIGCELGQCFARLGSRVTLLVRGEQLLPREDAEAAAYVERSLARDGVSVRKGHRPLRFVKRDDGQALLCRHQEQEVALAFDQVLVATGRVANLEGMGLEPLGIEVDERDLLEVDQWLRTRYPNILACGDLVGPHQFTHAASHQAWFAAVNALFGSLKKFRVDHRFIPFTTYTSPEVARIGLNEKEALDRKIPFEVTRYDLAELDRAITDEATEGMVKVLTPPGSDRILGVTIVGEHAGEMLAEFGLAMRHGLGLSKILATPHAYPTLNEANKFAAGNWRKAHSSAWLLARLERFHRWRRGERHSDSR